MLRTRAPGTWVLGNLVPRARVPGTRLPGLAVAGLPLRGMPRGEAAGVQPGPVAARRHADQVRRAGPVQEQGDRPVDAAGVVRAVGRILVAGERHRGLQPASHRGQAGQHRVRVVSGRVAPGEFARRQPAWLREQSRVRLVRPVVDRREVAVQQRGDPVDACPAGQAGRDRHEAVAGVPRPAAASGGRSGRGRLRGPRGSAADRPGAAGPGAARAGLAGAGLAGAGLPGAGLPGPGWPGPVPGVPGWPDPVRCDPAWPDPGWGVPAWPVRRWPLLRWPVLVWPVLVWPVPVRLLPGVAPPGLCPLGLGFTGPVPVWTGAGWLAGDRLGAGWPDNAWLGWA